MNETPAPMPTESDPTIDTTVQTEKETVQEHPQPVHVLSTLSKPSINKSIILYIVVLFVIGTIAGLILSNIFINETNDFIQRINQELPPFYSQSPLTAEQAILPSFGVVIVCISILLLIGELAGKLDRFFQ